MNAQTAIQLLPGRVGPIEVSIDRPSHPREGGGVAIVSHPHPLFGGTMDNKVVQTLARAHLQRGWTAVRFQFRGVGRSAGGHDGGIGETDDLLDVIQALAPVGPLALAGFSFGAFVTARAVDALFPNRSPASVLLVGTAASRFPVPSVPEELHERTLVIHGEQDDTVPLSAVMDWARPQSLPVMVIPGVEHFFHGRLPLLKALATRHIRACDAP